MMDVEKQIEEVMGLVQSVAQQHRASFMGSAKENSAYRSGADKLKNDIRNKLRTLLSSAQSGEQAALRAPAVAVPQGYRLQPLSEYDAMCEFIAAATQPAAQGMEKSACGYPELPAGSEACEFNSYAIVYDADEMREYVDADRRMRAALAAQANGEAA